MAVSSQEHKSLLNRIERLEDFIEQLTGEGQSETGSEPRVVSAIWNGSGELPIYSVMRFKVNTDSGNVNTKAARIAELEFMDIDDGVKYYFAFVQEKSANKLEITYSVKRTTYV